MDGTTHAAHVWQHVEQVTTVFLSLETDFAAQSDQLGHFTNMCIVVISTV